MKVTIENKQVKSMLLTCEQVKTLLMAGVEITPIQALEQLLNECKHAISEYEMDEDPFKAQMQLIAIVDRLNYWKLTQEILTIIKREEEGISKRRLS